MFHQVVDFEGAAAMAGDIASRLLLFLSG